MKGEEEGQKGREKRISETEEKRRWNVGRMGKEGEKKRKGR